MCTTQQSLLVRDKAVPSLWGQVRLLYLIRHLHGNHTLYPVCWSYWNGEDKTVTTRTVVRLLTRCGLLDKGHHVYMDNYYTSPELFEELRVHNTYACDTLKKNGCPISHKGETESTNISSNLQEERGVPADSTEVPRQAGYPHVIHHSWGHRGSFEQEWQKQQWVCCKTSLYCGLCVKDGKRWLICPDQPLFCLWIECLNVIGWNASRDYLTNFFKGRVLKFIRQQGGRNFI